MWAPAVPGPGLVHRENASKTVKAALTPSECRMPRPSGLDGGRGAWTIVPAMNGLNAICGICREIIS